MKLLITTQTIDLDDPILGFFHGWVAEFAKHFERIEVICLKEGRHELPPNVHVHSLGKEQGRSRLKYLWRFYTYFWTLYLIGRVDFVFFHMGAVHNILAAPFFFVRKLKHTQFYWWKTHGKVNNLKEKIALRFCDAVYTAGNKSFELKTNKLRVVGHAIDTEQFVHNLFRKHDSYKFMMVGRIVPIKKIEIALSAFAEIKKKESRATLDLIGDPDNVAYADSLRIFCQDRSLTGVFFLGSQVQSLMPSFYQHASILLHPAYEAGFDKVVLEAMASGVIPLTSIPSYEMILSPYGLYMKENDSSEYAEAALRILRMPEDERALMSANLRTIVVQNHSLKTLPSRIFAV